MWRAGKGSSEFLYGLPYLDTSRFDVGFVEGDDTSRQLRQRLCAPLEKRLSAHVGIGFGFHIALTHWRQLRDADLVISTVDTCGLPLAMLKNLGLLHQPLLYISQGLAHRMRALALDKAVNRAIFSAYRRFLHSADRVLVLGDGAVAPLADLFQLPPERIAAIPFGTDVDFWHPAAEVGDDGSILSVGSDPARDYVTLLRAANGRSLRIATRLSLPKDMVSEAVRIGSDHTQVELRGLYQRASFVVTPLHDVDQPSGQSATLQAMACGKAVVLTRTKGLWEPDFMQHMETCYLVEPGDVAGLAAAMAFLEAHPDERRRIGSAARQLVEQRYSARIFAQQLELHVRQLLAW
ncbi:MAG: hypothetical protein CL878_05145 [Dehalococcoidia bacterium]|nr:hypothetical protein [Dehalococcoidia bacterium]